MFTTIDPRQEYATTPSVDLLHTTDMIVSPPQGDTHVKVTRSYGSA